MRMTATPTPGVLVRHPDGKPLATAGEPIEISAYWKRRERDGDVTLAPIAGPAPAPTDSIPAGKKPAKA